MSVKGKQTFLTNCNCGNNSYNNNNTNNNNNNNLAKEIYLHFSTPYKWQIFLKIVITVSMKMTFNFILLDAIKQQNFGLIILIGGKISIVYPLETATTE